MLKEFRKDLIFIEKESRLKLFLNKMSAAMIQLTEKAAAHFLKIIQPGQSVVLSTKRSGCSGLKYCLELRDQFEAPLYHSLESKPGLPFYVEKKSLPYLKGLVIDWVTEGLQSRIVYNNPLESGKCGCGESFSVGELGED